MDEREIITISNADGKDIQYELVTVIETNDNKYLVYKDINDEVEDVDLYISKVVTENGNEIIEEIEDDKEWDMVSKVLDKMLKEMSE